MNAFNVDLSAYYFTLLLSECNVLYILHFQSDFFQDVHLQLTSYKDTILSYLNDGSHTHPMGNGATTTMGKDSMSMLTLSDSERPSMDQQTHHNSVSNVANFYILTFDCYTT